MIRATKSPKRSAYLGKFLPAWSKVKPTYRTGVPGFPGTSAFFLKVIPVPLGMLLLPCPGRPYYGIKVRVPRLPFQFPV
jgi:hypothetical protein